MVYCRDWLDEITTVVQCRLAPPHWLWHGRAYHFHTTNHKDILRRLGRTEVLDSKVKSDFFLMTAYTGMLDCSIPNCAYAIGVSLRSLPWGLTSCWVFVGFLVDIFVMPNEEKGGSEKKS